MSKVEINRESGNKLDYKIDEEVDKNRCGKLMNMKSDATLKEEELKEMKNHEGRNLSKKSEIRDVSVIFRNKNTRQEVLKIILDTVKAVHNSFLKSAILRE